MTIPVLVAWALSLFPVEYRGRGMGFWTSAFFLGQFVNPIFVSTLGKFVGNVQSTFLATGIICGVVLVIILVASKPPKVA